MATISAVRDALKSRIEAQVSGLRVLDTIPAGEVRPPVAVVIPDMSERRTLGASKNTERYRLRLALSAASERTAQDQLDGYLSSSGATSIQAALAVAPRSLGVAGITAWVSGWENYGAVDIAGYVYFGADVLITVEN